MTADLELWLRGLWVNPSPCPHARVKVYQALDTLRSIYRCLDCELEAQVDQMDVLSRRQPSLVWGPAAVV